MGAVQSTFHINLSKRYVYQKKYEISDMLFDCMASIFLNAVNEAGVQDKLDDQLQNIKNGKIRYRNCLKLEFKMPRINYLVRTLCSLSKIYSVENDTKFWKLAIFQAEQAVCLCDDPIECWQLIIAAETLCYINLKQGNRLGAKSIC